ncbi:MAG TPA: hypothetical protein VFW71_13440 [Actinomycetota bacterium]|nr:hypothetical protein [Actinomycetota bacterium]
MAAAADRARTARPGSDAWACAGADHVLIALACHGRSDADLWIDGQASCQQLTNGRLRTTRSFTAEPRPPLNAS